MEIGVDIVRVKRIEQAILKNENFKYKIFTQNEINYCEKRKNKYQSYAGKFAAKEAFSKAFGTGFRDKFGFLDIEVLNDELGKPYIKYSDKKIKISIAHEAEYAIATVLIE